MHITLHAVGRQMPGWVQQACQDYCKRLPSQYRFQLREYAQAKSSRDRRSSNARNVSQDSVAMLREGETILDALASDDYVVVLDSPGEIVSTRELAARLQRWQLDGRNLAFVIGGPDGLSAALKARADFTLSLSALTLPHPLVRVVLLEQLYRAHAILINHPYHRE